MHELMSGIRNLIENATDKLECQIEDLEYENTELSNKLKALQKENAASLEDYNWLLKVFQEENAAILEEYNWLLNDYEALEAAACV